MFQAFRDVEKICEELEKIRISAQASEIVFHQTGENCTADRFVKLENKLSKAIAILSEKE
ncbi:MAG: hypothetical protein AB9917_01540 [Negativicutes bacterium]